MRSLYSRVSVKRRSLAAEAMDLDEAHGAIECGEEIAHEGMLLEYGISPRCRIMTTTIHSTWLQLVAERHNDWLYRYSLRCPISQRCKL
jgi:hypothetical protein